MNFSFIKLVVISVFISAPVQSQNYQLTKYSREHGLPQSQINDVIQDEFGYLWIATEGGGIARFDGKNFKIWNEKDGLISDFATRISVIENKLFIGTDRGLSIKNLDEIYSYKSSRVNEIIQLSGAVYLATNKGIKVFNNLSINQYDLNSELNQSIVHDIQLIGNSVWIASNIGLYKVNSFGKKNQKIVKINKFHCNNVDEYNNDIITATKNKGVVRIFNKSLKEESISDRNEVKSIYINSDENELWFSSVKHGIERVDLLGDNKLLKTLVQTKNESFSKVIQDNSSNYWLGTPLGLVKLSLNNFDHYLKGNKIEAIHSNKSSLYVGSESGGLVLLDSVGIKRIPNLNQKVVSIDSDDAEKVFIGTEDSMLVLDSSKVVDTISFFKNISKILVSQNETWLASTTSGIARINYEFTTRKIKDSLVFTKLDGLYDLSINDIQIDHNGKLWYVTSKGYLGSIESNRVKHLGKLIPNNPKLSSIAFHNNSIFIGTQGNGIWWSNLKAPLNFNHIHGNMQLESKNINQLIFDKQKDLWVGTQTGIERVELNELNEIQTIQHFGKYDGFNGIETTQNTVDMDVNGNIWFGTVNGLTKYVPADNKIDSIKPEIHFESIEIAFSKIESIKSSEVTHLKPEDNDLSFIYRTVDINHPDDIKYRWRLRKENWSNWSPVNSVVFANMNSGSYNFEVQSKTSNELVSVPIEFQFVIDESLIQKLWFQLLILLVFLFVIALIIWNYIKNIRIRNSAKQREYKLENDLLVLEQKALRLQMNPHFVFNVLNGIKAFGTTDIKKMSTTIQKFAVLLRSTLNNSRHEFISIKEEIIALKAYIDVEQIMTMKPFDVKFKTDKNLDLEELMIPPMLIQPFVENAIEHGISKVENKGVLQVLFNQKNEKLCIEVIDNGIGFKTSLKNNKTLNHQSLALKVTKERIQAIYGFNSFKMEELIKDSKVLGTKVTIVLPLLTDF